eukprot:5097455-Amphidinium_carterae.2
MKSIFLCFHDCLLALAHKFHGVQYKSGDASTLLGHVCSGEASWSTPLQHSLCQRVLHILPWRLKLLLEPWKMKACMEGINAFALATLCHNRVSPGAALEKQKYSSLMSNWSLKPNPKKLKKVEKQTE